MKKRARDSNNAHFLVTCGNWRDFLQSSIFLVELWTFFCLITVEGFHSPVLFPSETFQRRKQEG